jgi:hypothetical protein
MFFLAENSARDQKQNCEEGHGTSFTAILKEASAELSPA